MKKKKLVLLPKKKTALLSVYYKDGIVEFARALIALGWQILSSGGTAKALQAAGVPVIDIEVIVGPPMFEGRVKTLSRELHAGMLARKLEEDLKELERLGLPRIGIVCVDFYDMKAEIARPGSTRESVIELTDVGGPTMLHSGAKGERIVVCDLQDRARVIEWLKAGCPDEQNFIDQLCAKADAIVADYCLAASRYRSGGKFDGVVGQLVQTCKYGENPSMTPAGSYKDIGNNDPLALHNFKVIDGADPSYINWTDVDRMLQTMTHLAAAFDVNKKFVPRLESPKLASGVKHGNTCGGAAGNNAIDVINRMLSGDLRAIFGGWISTNFRIGVLEAEALLRLHLPPESKADAKRLLDGVVAPSFAPEVIRLFERKEGKCRLVVNPALEKLDASSLDTSPRRRQVRGGYLLQPNYTYIIDFNDPRIKRFGPRPTAEQFRDLIIGWAVGSTSNSNTITTVIDGKVVGNGCGGQDRVGVGDLSVKKANDARHYLPGASSYSDSFFPFPDGPEVLAKAGIKAILTSSGSINDELTIEVCERYGISLIMVPDKVGRGFFGH
jgi:phosphoribosylaminoimidazolecarboxamide formyltransferase/IMP cyclohydrolase